MSGGATVTDGVFPADAEPKTECASVASKLVLLLGE